MGILSMAGDQLKYDPLKEDPLKFKYDQLSKDAGKRVATYDKDYGYAMLPEEKAAAEAYKSSVDEAAAQQQSAINTYKSQAGDAIAKADATAAGILSDAKSAANSIAKPSYDLVPIRIVDASGTKVEQVYNLPRSVAEELEGTEGLNSSWVDKGKNFNVSVRTDGGGTAGKELHDILNKAQAQMDAAMKIGDSSYDTAKQVSEMSIDSTQKEIDIQKGIATAQYNQNLDLGGQTLDMIKGKWTTYITDQRAAFQEGIKTNNGGIGDLIKSGALSIKGSV